MTSIAVIGDIHGCIDEFTELYEKLCHESIDEIWTTGDLVDRGPDSGACIDFCIKYNIRSTMGNHEHTTLQKWKAHKRGMLFRNPDKTRTLNQLNDERVAWMTDLPLLHCVDDLNLVLVHGGLWPIPIYAQPLNVIRAQMIKLREYGKCKWWGDDAIKMGYTEEEITTKGWRRWYEIYNRPENVVYGHSVFAKPFDYRAFPDAGRTLGIDTGSCFGGKLTAAIIGPDWVKKFVTVNPRANYAGTKFLQEDL